MALSLADLLRVKQELGYYGAGGGRRSTGEQVGDALSKFGGGMTSALTGISQGQKLKSDVLGSRKSQMELDILDRFGAKQAEADLALKQAQAFKAKQPQELDFSMRPAIGSGYAKRDFIKTIIPDLGEADDLTIGELQQRIQLAKQNIGASLQEQKEKRAEERQSERDVKKPLSGEAAKVESISTTIVPEVNQLKQAFSSDYNNALKGIVLGTDRRLSKLVDNIADKIGRLRSGGAINKEEEARFKRQIASFMDIPFGKPEDAVAALDGILAEADRVAKSIRPRPEQNIKLDGGERRTKNGVTYEKREDGLWHPVP